MNRLMEDTYKSDQIRGRATDLRRDTATGRIFYRAPNRWIFTIDTGPVAVGGAPIVTTPIAEEYGPSHETYTYYGGRVDLPIGVQHCDLKNLLSYIELWAEGMETYQRTGVFLAKKKGPIRRKFLPWIRRLWSKLAKDSPPP